MSSASLIDYSMNKLFMSGHERTCTDMSGHERTQLFTDGAD